MGQTIHYEYNSDNRLQKISYSTGEVIEITSPEWINAGNATEEQSISVKQSGLLFKRGQQVSEVIPSANGQIKAVRKQGGEQIDLQRDENNQLANIAIGQQGRISQQYQLNYDSAGNLVSQRNTVNDTATQTEYNERGQKIYEKDPEGRETTWVYNDFGELITEQRGASKNTHKSYQYYEDGGHRGLKKSQNERGVQSHFTYDAQGNLQSHTKGNLGDTSYEKISYERDGAGNLLKKTEGNHLRETSYTYDVYNELLSVTEARGISTFSYENFRRTKRLTDPLGRQFILELNDQQLLHKKILPNGLNWALEYNQERQPVQKINPNGEVIAYRYGSKGKFVKETLPDGWVNQKKYTEGEALLWTKNKYLRSTTLFDENGFNLGFDYLFNGQAPIQVRFITDKTGQKKRMTVKRPVRQVKAYDENNQLITSGMDFDNSDDVLVEKDSAGKVVKITKGGLSNEFVYDTQGTLVEVQSKGQVVEETHEENLLQPMNYSYNDQGQLVSITGGDFGVTFVYHSNGQLAAIERYNNTRTDYVFHSSGKPASVVEKTTRPNSPEVAISSQAYQYNQAGDCIQWTKDQQNWNLRYDANDQLEAATTSGQSFNYAYDQVGNRVQYNQDLLTYDAHSLQCTGNSSWEFGYDANGNLTQKTNKANPAWKQFFSYNALRQMVAFREEDGGTTPVVEANYTYGAAGRRIGKKVVYRDTPNQSYTRWYVYDQDNILLELDEYFQPVRQYIHALGTDTIIGFIEQDQVYYLSKDAFGNVIGILDAQGDWVARYQYDPFGVPVATGQAVTVSVPFRFASREWDEESQTYFFRNRQYDPVLGRFLQPDPHTGDPEDPMSIFSPYCYARNNPLKYADPYGLLWFFLVGLVALIKTLVVTAIVLSAVGLIVGALGGLVSLIAGNGFREGFRTGFRIGVTAPAFLVRVTLRATLVRGAVGVLGAVLGGTVGAITRLIRGGNVWQGFLEGAELGWRIGRGSVDYIANLPGEISLVLLNVVLPEEFGLLAYNERWSSFLTYCCLMDDADDFGNIIEIQDRLPDGFVVEAIDDTAQDITLINANSRMYTAYDANENSTLVVFTATDSAQDWIENVLLQLVTRVNWPNAPLLDRLLFKPQVGAGFWRDYQVLRDRMFERIQAIDAVTGNDNPIYVTGFSLGGGMAVLAGLDIAQQLNREVHVYSIAGPKVGNAAFVELFRSEVNSAHKLINKADIVPRIPLPIQGYSPAPLVRFFDEPGGGLDFSLIRDRHNLRTYLNNILQDAMGGDTAIDVDFQAANTIAFLSQMAPHAFDFMPLGNLAGLVEDVITVVRNQPIIINGNPSKNPPALS